MHAGEFGQRASRGESQDRAHFLALYEPLAAILYAWARLRIAPSLRARLDPEDLAQEVCCRALLCFDSFDADRGPFRAWLFGIGNIVLKDLGRQLARLPDSSVASRIGKASGVGSNGLEQIPVEMTSIASRAARSESLEIFLASLESLPSADRQLILYRGFEGLSLVDTAALLGIGLEATTKRWQRLRARLREGPLSAQIRDD